tara:strand:+ start:333 stop:1763 length:1431 start_codon:yes stop_codon:yes gene_type:complete
MDKIIPIILCGGKGTRLWPLSRECYPKQFLSLCGDSEKSLLQKTYERIANIKGMQEPIVICNEQHRFLVAEQFRSIGIKPKAIILEPEGRNTAPAVTLGALKFMESKEDAILLVLSADHQINNNFEYLKSIESGKIYAESGNLVTFGVIPTSPETDYGYIESEDKLDIENLQGSKIKYFIEKPEKQLAEKLYKNKNMSWNSGIFMFKASTFIEELEKNSKTVAKHCKDAMINNKKDLDFIRINNDFFKKSPNISIDVAVMEKTKLGIVIPLKAGWSDLGNWNSLWENEPKDSSNNVIKGKTYDYNSKNSYITSENRLLLTIGLNDLIVVENSDAVLVSDKKNLNHLKSMVGKLEEAGYKESISHKKIYRPWGNFTSIADNKGWQVKKIEVNIGSKLSLQMHNHRSEHWIVVKGFAEVEINKVKTFLKENESIFIPLGSKHRLSNAGDSPLIVIEVQTGDYLGEDDIVRFEDVYGRN